MDAEVKQRNRRRKRAQRMQAQRDMTKNADSNEEDESPVREKPPRPPNRRKKSKEPLVEEDIVDGFAILGFKTYDDLETVVKIAKKENVLRLVDIERPKHEPRPHITHHISAHPPHGLTLTQDPATSDDSGRASERLTGSSVAPRDADSSRDRLSDASSRCSSGKGYICDSEGDDDKEGGRDESAPQEKEGRQETVETPLTSPSDEIHEGSDASSVIFGSTPGSRKHEFPGALPPSLPSLSNGASSSPVPAPTPPDLPAPSPSPAQLPPPPPVTRHVVIEEKRAAEPMTITPTTPNSLPSPAPAAVAPAPPVTIPNPPTAAATTTPSVTNLASISKPQVPQPAAAPVIHHPPALGSSKSGNHARTESPAVATSAPGYHPPYQPLYTPYAATPHTPYTTASIPTTTHTSTTVTASSHVATTNTPTTRIHSPARERERESRESYSNVSSLSRTSVTPLSCSQPTTTVSSSLSSKAWAGPQPQVSPAPRPTPPPLHSAPYNPIFAAPLPPPTVTRASPSVATPPSNPNPFSAESLFQSSNQADMLRRELDNRFLASQDSRAINVAPPPYLRTEMHQHQHHHTHVHQHTTSLLPPPPSSSIFPSPMFKEIPKLGSHDSPFFRQNMNMPPNYPPGYGQGLLHPGLTGPTPFVPPSHLPAFQPKPSAAEQGKPKITKSGKWNAMHVRVAWEIYHHQHKGDKTGPGTLKSELLRPPTHLFNPSVRSHDLPPSFQPSLAHRPAPPTFEQQHPHPSTLFASPGSHLGSGMSPFTRYGSGAPGFVGPNPSPFSVTGYSPASSRPNELPQMLHDPWRRGFPPGLAPSMPPNPWAIKPDPLMEQREREERERERMRREREERERREREEKRRLEQQQAEQRERERREKERREMEHRERERLLHQQRMVEAAKPLQSVIRDRSPMRNGDGSDIRIKEEPRIKEEDASHLLRTSDPRYHPYLRTAPTHSLQPPLSRVLPPSALPHHYAPPSAHWPPHADPFYRYDALRYGPLMDAMRVEEERAKMFSSYAHATHQNQLRSKDPGLMHLRPGPGPPPSAHNMCATPPTEMHKKEEPR